MIIVYNSFKNKIKIITDMIGLASYKYTGI